MEGQYVTYKHFIATIISLVIIVFSTLAYISPIGREEFKLHLDAEAEYRKVLNDKLNRIDSKIDKLLEG